MSGAPGGTPAALETRGLSVRYGERAALTEVTLRVRPGEFVALVGPNGSGKTTLIRAALGLVAPASGSIDILGRPAPELSILERARRIAWVPQEESPYDNVPIVEYVLYGRHPHLPPFGGESASDRAAVRTALESVRLWDLRDHGIHEVSGGERQRVLLARALAQETPIILLDEPTSHLDVGHQLDLLERVRALCRDEGKAIIAAIHDLNLAARYSGRLVVLSRGRVVADGPPREVLSESLLHEVWGILAEVRDDPRTGLPYLVPRLPAPARVRPSGGIRGFGPVHVVGGGGSAASVLRDLVSEGFRVTAGVLHMLDTDTEAALELDIPIAAEAPFAPISPEVRARNAALLDAATAIVVAPFAVGPSNLANLEDVRVRAGRLPIFRMRGEPGVERDFTGGAASRLLAELAEAGSPEIADRPGLVAALRALPALLPPAGRTEPAPA